MNLPTGCPEALRAVSKRSGCPEALRAVSKEERLPRLRAVSRRGRGSVARVLRSVRHYISGR